MTEWMDEARRQIGWAIDVAGPKVSGKVRYRASLITNAPFSDSLSYMATGRQRFPWPDYGVSERFCQLPVAASMCSGG